MIKHWNWALPWCTISSAQPSIPDAETLLSRSIAYHDPGNRFLSKAIAGWGPIA